MDKFRIFLISLISLSAIYVVATEPAMPPQIVTNAKFDERILYRAISDNGKWAVAEVRPDYDGGKVIDLSDMSYVTVTNLSNDGKYGRPLDITDDGRMAAGTYGNADYPQPAIWIRETGEWKELPYDKDLFGAGHAVAITPDGKYACGRLMGKKNMWTEATALWDLETWKLIDLPNLPTPLLDTYNQHHNRFVQISSDARYLIAELTPGGYNLYDRNTGKYSRPKGMLADGREATVIPTDMSPNCRYLHGHANIAGNSAYDKENDEWTNECIYDMADGTVTLLRDSHLADLMVWGVTDNGTLFAGSEGNGTPLRNFQIYANEYWYALDQVLWQEYGIDYYQLTQYTNTGTPYAFSADGRIFASFVDPNRGEGWVMKFDEDIAEICKRVDLMGNYEVAPTPGVAMSSLPSVKMGFDRNIALLGDASSIVLYDGAGKQLAKALNATIDGNKVTIVFRRQKKGDGEIYRIHIPAGTLAMAGVPSLTNKDIDIVYKGRSDLPVELEENAPTEFTMRTLDYSTNFITLPFKSEIILADNAGGILRCEDDGVTVTDLLLSVSGKNLIIRSTAGVPLFKYSDYRVIIPEMSFTDPGASIATGNKEISLLIHGNYEEQPEDENIIMSENFDNGLGNKFMFYEGDHLTPSQTMKNWEFTADTTPWWIVRDDIYSSNYAAASHSDYAGGGTSDDWMVIRRMYIPDDGCHLQFDSQSYRNGFDDRLNVYVIPSELQFNTVTDEAISIFKEKRELVYSEVQTPGEEEELLENDWRHNDISLADYAGKYVYVAFVNENTGGSAIFVDNVSVSRNMVFSLSELHENRVVAQESQQISVKLYVNAEGLEFSDIQFTLFDDADKVIDTQKNMEGTTIDREHPCEIKFASPLPLQAGSHNRYSIGIKAGEFQTRFDRTITNLLFATAKTAVLEEFSGASCGNCPDGIVIIDLLKRDFGDRFLPLTIRSYMGDENTPVNSDYASLLGLEQLGAPSGCVNRRFGGYPVDRGAEGIMVPHTGSVENGLWYDFVAHELAIRSYADISASVQIDEEARNISVPVSVSYAVDCENIDHSLFAVLAEDDVVTFQSNYRANTEDPLLGEWGAGGIYGESFVYPYHCDDVVRNVSHSNLIGKPGIIPADLKAGDKINQTLDIAIPRRNINLDKCHITVMLIDNVTGYVDNAIRVPLTSSASYAIVNNPSVPSIISDGEYIRVLSADDDMQVTLTDINGTVLETFHGAEINIKKSSIRRGMTIISAMTHAGQSIKKIIK